MESSPVLRQQSQNKIRCLRMKNEQKAKKLVDPKPSKSVSASHLSNKDIENKDPGSSAISKKAPVRPGVSRLPVLAKSLHLQTPSDFSQTHCRWEEKPLAGKAKKKKPCTRPVPFNLSQPKSTRMAAENQPLAAPQLRTHAKSPKHPAALNSNTDSARAVGKSFGNTTENTSHLSGPTGPSSTFKTPTLSTTMFSLTDSAAMSAQPGPSAEACLSSMNLLSLKDHSKTLHASRTTQPTMQCSSSKAEKGENFQPDHAALLSILRNEGVGVTGLASATSQSKPYNYLPQRVSVMKSRQKAGPPAGSVKAVPFSPDPAALQSILQNEGVKAGGPVGATPRSSVCPPSRGTSIYTAQRVPVRKNHLEATPGPGSALKETPLNKWTPQRVRNPRHQPMSAMKWHHSSQQSPYGTPGFKSCKSNFQPRQEEVVQRLFEEDEQGANVTEQGPETQAQRPVQASANKPPCGKEVEKSRTNDDDDDDEKLVGGQMFLQAQPRESVIFFSTGKKLFRAPRIEKLEDSGLHNQCAPLSSDERKVLPVRGEVPAVPEPSCKINPSVQRLHRDLIGQKSCSVSSAVIMLRKRFPPLVELRLDEEVANYTSASVQAPLPPRPSCGNPLASILHFKESTSRLFFRPRSGLQSLTVADGCPSLSLADPKRFVPIGFERSSGPPSPLQDS